MASIRIGAASGSAFVTCGGMVSSGTRPVNGATLSRTSWMATLMSFSRLKVMVVFELPWPEFVRNSSIPSMLLMVSSIGLVIWVSTSSGLAPFNRTMMLTVGDSVRGIKSTPRSRYEKTPSTTRATDIMMANTGRRIHTSAIFTDYFLLAVRRYRSAGLFHHVHRVCGLHHRYRFWCRHFHPCLPELWRPDFPWLRHCLRRRHRGPVAHRRKRACR